MSSFYSKFPQFAICLIFKELGISMSAVNDLLNNQVNFRANTAEGIQLLANSVSGLTANQQALLLSSKNLSAETVRQILETNELTKAEIDHAMAMAGLATTTKNLTYQKLQDVLVSQTGNVEKAKEIATILGVEAAEESEIVTLKGLSYAQLEAKLTQAGLNQEQIKSIAIQLGYTTGIAKATTATTIFGHTLKGLLFSLKSAGLAIKTFALSHPIVSGIAIAITAAATAWGIYKHNQEELSKAEEAANEREKERTESLKQEIEDIDSIIKEYKELGNKTELTADEKDRLIDLQKKLNKSYDTESKGIDLVNGKYDEQIQKLKSLNAEKQDSLRRSIKSQRQSAYSAYHQNDTNNIFTKTIAKAIKSDFEDDMGEDFYSRLTKAIFEKGITGVTANANGNISVSGNLNSEEKLEALKEIQEALSRVTTEADKQTLSFRLLNDRVEGLVKHYSEEVDNYNSLLQDEVELLASSFSYNGIDIDNITQETGIAWRDALKDTFAKDDPQLRLAINDYYDDYIFPTFQNNNDELAEKLSFKWSEFYDEQGLEDVEKKLKTLKTAYKSLEENGTLSNDEKSDLLKDYPRLLDVIDDPNKLKVALQSSANDAISAAQLVLSNLYLAAKAGSLEESNLREALEVLEGMADVSSKVTDQYAEQKEILKKQIYDTKQLINRAKEKKEVEQENLETFKKQKEALEKILDDYETAASVITDYIDEQIDSLEEQKNAIQETYDKQIQALEDEADERERINDLREKELELEKAKNTQVRVYDSERGWVIQQNKEAVEQAKREYDNAVKDSKVTELEKERDEALNPFENQITELETYKKSWEDAVKTYQKVQDEMTAAAVFGSNWRNIVIEKDISAIDSFVQNYNSTAYELHGIVEPQIEQTEKNIDVIEKEIDSYEDLQNKQKSYLDFFKTYSKDFATAVGEQKEALVNFANAIKNNATASELFRLYDTVMSKFSSDYIPEFANGGVSTSTGLAMLHGTKQKSEVTFNAEDARKLYEAIHGSSSIQLGNQLAKNLISSALQSTRDSASVVNNNQPTKIENTWVINEPKFSSSEDYRVFANHMDRYVREANMNRLVGKR